MEIISIKWFEYLIGVLQGDGNITFNKNKNGDKKPSGVCITVGYDAIDYRQRLLEIISLTFDMVKIKIYDGKTASHIMFFNTIIAQNLYKFKQNGIWSVPDLIYPNYYLAGLWDTDGYIGTNLNSKMELSIKKSGNLEIVKNKFKELGFNWTKINYCKKTNAIGTFEYESIYLSCKEDCLLFYDTIPLQHPRKIKELEKRKELLNNIIGRRRHLQMAEETIRFLQTNPLSDSGQIANHLNKPNRTHITKELLRYVKLGYIKRHKVNKKYLYTCVEDKHVR